MLNNNEPYYKMIKRITILIILLVFSIETWSQIDYSNIQRIKFHSANLDTTSTDILRLNKKYAIIYFKKSDIKELINNLSLQDSTRISSTRDYSDLENYLNSNEQIRLTDWWYDYTDAERKEQFGSIDYKNNDKKYIDKLYYLCPDLLYNNKSMIVDKDSKEVVKDNMIIKRVNGFMGTVYLDFLLPNKMSIWQVYLSLGE